MPVSRRKNNKVMDLKETGYEGAIWFIWVGIQYTLLDVVNEVMNL
jgi:hypothetical protein